MDKRSYWTDAEYLAAGYRFAEARDAGLTTHEIAAREGMRVEKVQKALRFIEYRPKRAAPVSADPRNVRPDWSYPDPITLQIVREAREEMRAAGGL